MEAVKWTSDLSVGVPVIDEQHKALIGRLNDLSAAIHEHEGASHITRTLSFLIDYTHYHFDAEEKFMGESEYPNLESHREKHKEFKSTLAGLEQDFREEGSTQALADAMNTLLGNWLTNHIRGVDQLFGRYLAEKGIKLGGEA